MTRRHRATASLAAALLLSIAVAGAPGPVAHATPRPPAPQFVDAPSCGFAASLGRDLVRLRLRSAGEDTCRVGLTLEIRIPFIGLLTAVLF